MKIIYKILLLALFSVRILAGFDLNLAGDKILKEDFIKKYLSSLQLSENPAEQLQVYLQAEAERRGYLDARISVSLVADTAIFVNINSGPRYRIKILKYADSGQALTEMENALEEMFGNAYASEENINSLLEALADYYIDNGYPFAQSEIMSMEKSVPDNLQINLKVIPGPAVTIDSLRFICDKNISGSFLRRKAGLSPGRPFSQEQLDNSMRRLNSIEYVRLDSLPREYYYNNLQSCLLTYYLRQGMQNRIEGALGYNPKTAARKAFLFGYLDLSIKNPLGDGKCFYVNWNRPGETSSRFSLAMDYPYPLGSPFELRPSLSQEKYEELYLSLSVGLDFSLEIQTGSILRGTLGWTRITARGESFSSLYNSRVYKAALGLDFSNSKPGGIVFEGGSLSLRVVYLHKRLYRTLGKEPRQNSIDPIKAEIGMQYGRKLLSGLFFDTSAKFEGYSGNQDLISPAEMIRLGGRKTLRGYSEEQFLTPRAFWANNEVGMVSGNLFKGYLFADLGYARLTRIYSSEGVPQFENKFLFGAGLGLGLFSERTGLDLSLGWSRDDSFGEGKLYVVLKNRF